MSANEKSGMRYLEQKLYNSTILVVHILQKNSTLSIIHAWIKIDMVTHLI